MSVNLEYLESLKGKVVQVFKGGPESRIGKLLSVRSDYLVINTIEEGVVVYRTNHIKSLIENSTTSMNTSNNDAVISMMPTLEEANSFSDLLTAMKGNMVRIDRGGPESRNGRLLDVKSDYLVLYTEKDGVVYYQLEHVKSLSYAKHDKKERSEDNSSREAFVKPDYIETDNFSELLSSMRYKWVTINRGGPEKMQGVLADSNDDHLVLICEKEVCRIATYHIRNISYILKQESNETSEDTQYQQQSDDSSENNQNNEASNQNQNQKQEKNNNKNKNSKKSFSVKMYSGVTKTRM